MLFMPPGSRVLELALPEPCFRDYMHLAAAMNHVAAVCLQGATAPSQSTSTKRAPTLRLCSRRTTKRTQGDDAAP